MFAPATCPLLSTAVDARPVHPLRPRRYLHTRIMCHLAYDVYRLPEAYYYDEVGQQHGVTAWQGFQYLFVRHNIPMAIGIFCVVIGCALWGFWAYHMWLVWCGTTTNETFKWGDLEEELRARMQEQQRNRKEKVTHRVKVPANIYNRGFLRNLWEVIVPPSSTSATSFEEAVRVGGAMTSFPLQDVPISSSSQPVPGGDEAEAHALESDDFDESDDGGALDGALHAHAD